MSSFSVHLASGSWWIAIPAILIGIGLAVWTYRHTVPRTTPARRRLLVALRSVAIALILFVLFQPILTLTKTQERTPRVVIMLDNSRSMQLPPGPGDTARTRLSAMHRNLLSIFPESFRSDRSARLLEVFSERASSVDTPFTHVLSSMKADGSATDIAGAFGSLAEAEKSQNISAVVLFSDGAYTAGSNPLYAAERLGVPVFAVGLGDSSERRDVGITSMFTNDIATVGVSQPVDIEVHAAGANAGEKAVVSLYAESEKIAEEEVTFKAGANDAEVSVNYTPAQEGSVKLTARVTPLSGGEATMSNNVSIRYVNVLKNKFHIVLFAGAPSPDVSFVRDYFRARKEIELTTYIQKQGAEFYEGTPTFEKLHDADLVIVIGFPIASTSTESMALLKRLVVSEGKSMLFVPSKMLDIAKLREIEEALPFTLREGSASGNELSVSAAVNQSTVTNPILRADKEQTAAVKWESLAPLAKTEMHFAPKPESDVLIEATVQGVKIGEPMLLSRTVGKSREIAFTSYGLWRWKLTSFGRERAFASLSHTKDTAVGSESALDLFLGNATRWLVMRDDRKRVRIEPTQRLYDAGETIEFTAQVYDESFEPVDGAIVSMKVAGPGLKQALDLTLEPLSNGRYSARLPQGLPAGDYTYSGSAVSGKVQIGTDGGRFNVGEYSIEFAEPRMRSELLREIAARTGGAFFTPENDADLLSRIRALPSYQPKKIEERSEYEARTAWYFLVLAIGLLSAEWFLRKRSGML